MKIDFTKLIVIMGATGSGKSKLARKITERLPCEIISADSMQVYKGMNIGTAKPTSKEQQTIKHHLIDILDIHKRLDVYLYVKKAEEAIKKGHKNDHFTLVVGGSGMYIRALLYGLDPLPTSADLRIELNQKYSGKGGTECLSRDIAEADPKMLQILGNNHRKLLRAMEVFKLTGKSILQQQKIWQINKLQYPVCAYNTSRERSDLFERIENRTNQMLSEGWIDETKILIDEGLLGTPTAKQAIGYNIISKYLSNEINYNEMKIRIIASTKKYARRQETWFKNQHPEAIKIDMSASSEKLADDICRKVQ